MRKERVVLEDHAEAATLRCERIDTPLVEPDLARARREQPGEEIQRGGLAAARGAEEGDELPAPHLEGEVVEDVLRPEVLAQAEPQPSDHVRLDRCARVTNARRPIMVTRSGMMPPAPRG